MGFLIQCCLPNTTANMLEALVLRAGGYGRVTEHSKPQLPQGQKRPVSPTMNPTEKWSSLGRAEEGAKHRTPACRDLESTMVESPHTRKPLPRVRPLSAHLLLALTSQAVLTDTVGVLRCPCCARTLKSPFQMWGESQGPQCEVEFPPKTHCLKKKKGKRKKEHPDPLTLLHALGVPVAPPPPERAA